MQKFLKDNIVNLILGDERFKSYTSAIISAILKIPYKDVYDNLQYKSNRINYNVVTKYSATDNMYELDDNIINIEINYNSSLESINKNMRYICHLLLKQVKPGKKDIYKKVIQININNYDYFGKNGFIYKSNVREENYNIKRNDLIEIYDINIEYLKKISYNKVRNMDKTSLERLLYIYTDIAKGKLDVLYEGDVMMKEVIDELYFINEDGNLSYDWLEFQRREQKELGMKEGIKEAIKKMASNGLTSKKISEIMNITVEEVDKIIK